MRGMIVFLGDSNGFSDWILRIAEAEAPSMDVCRVDRLEDLPPTSGAKRFIIVADDMARDMLANPKGWIADHPGARWILAYRDEKMARQLLALRRRCDILASIGLLPMNLPVDQWTPMFRLALSGDCVVPARLLDTDALPDKPVHPRVDPLHASLTPREREVLALVSEGKRNKTIAHELSLTEHTIKLHLHHIMKKISVRNRTQAAQWFLTRQQGGTP
ncbi:hypothetical protein CCR87_12295 [Rhodobaculum claviforme]|uniref:HTH luxR-type domain-containing protein n=2 Tax=Rhodobaculum claviforme TaxID=1549854 RepID=A0A934TN36_9RHOB|nr:hypothetical protein [Rhodobaculum claviforme]